MNLLPTTEGQPLVMTIAGDEFGVERGHWYSPEAVQNAIDVALEDVAKELEQGVYVQRPSRYPDRDTWAFASSVLKEAIQSIRSRIGPKEEK